MMRGDIAIGKGGVYMEFIVVICGAISIIAVAFIVRYLITGEVNEIKTSSFGFSLAIFACSILLQFFTKNDPAVSSIVANTYSLVIAAVVCLDGKRKNGGFLFGRIQEKTDSKPGVKGVLLMAINAGALMLMAMAVSVTIQIFFLGNQSLAVF